MSPQIDLYNNSYSNYETDVYRQIRLATYGEDLGQTSWVTNVDYTATSASKVQTAVSGGYYFQYMIANGLLTFASLTASAGQVCDLPRRGSINVVQHRRAKVIA